jgi:hypothetical protein
MEKVLTQSRILFGASDKGLTDFPLAVHGSCLVLFGRPDVNMTSLFSDMHVQATNVVVHLYQPTEKDVVTHNTVKFRIPVTAISHLAYHAAIDLTDPDTSTKAEGLRIQVATTSANYILDVIIRDVDISMKLDALQTQLDAAMKDFGRLSI